MIHRMKKGARYSKIGPAAGFGDGHFPDTGAGDRGKSVAFLFPVELFRRILMDRNRRVERNRRESLLLNPRLIVHVAVFLFFLSLTGSEIVSSESFQFSELFLF